MNSDDERSSLIPPHLKLTLRPRIFLLLCIAAAFWTLGPILPGLLTGSVFAFLSEPLTRKLQRLLGVQPHTWRGTAVAFLTIALIVAGFLLPFGIVVVGALEQISVSLRDLSGASISESVKHWTGRLELLFETLPIPINSEQLTNLLTHVAQKSLALLGNSTADLLAQMPGAVFFATVALLSWGYSLWRGKLLRIRILRFLFPWPQERALVRNTFAQMLKSLVAANILVSLIQAAVIGIFLASTGVPHVLLWTSLSFFASFIPVVGTLPVTLGSALWCWTVADSVPKAVVVLVGAVIAGTADNFLRPLLARGSGQLDSFLLFLAIISGLGQFGAAGFILGPLALALCQASATTLRSTLRKQPNEILS